MRFYNIVVTNPQTGALVTGPSSVIPGSTFTNYANGQIIPSGLNIELDIPIIGYASPTSSGAFVRVWGISLAEIGQSNDLNGMNISVYAGMKAGLPLAKPQQSGLVLQGQIFQAFGNWHGTSMTLDLIVLPDVGTINDPKNISIDWKRGTPFAPAVAAMLKTAFPTYKQVIAVSPNLIAPCPIVGYYHSLNEFAQAAQRFTQPIIGGNYPGVDVTLFGDTITVYDQTQPFGATTQTAPLQLAFEDMIGQPTWIDPVTVIVQLVLRADIMVGDYVKFPAGIGAPFVLTSVAAAIPNTPAREKSAFQGTFFVTEIHHYGNLRQRDAASWNTTVSAQYIPAAQS